MNTVSNIREEKRVAELQAERFDAKAQKRIEERMNDILSGGDELTASKYKIYVDLTCQDKGLEFENASAKFNFETLVMYKTKELMPKFYDIIHPPVYMDSRGNYTTDSSKWA